MRVKSLVAVVAGILGIGIAPIAFCDPPAGQTFNVDPAGPLKTISDAARLAHPGDTVLIAPGTYHETLWLTRSGTADRPITIAGKAPEGVIIDGTGLSSVVSSNHAVTTHIVLKNLTIQHCRNPAAEQVGAITTGTGWRLEDVTVDGADGTGINVYGDSIVLLRVAVKNCGRAGLSGDGCSNVLVQDCVTTGNNTLKNDPDIDAGAGKWVKTDHVTIDGLVSHDNIGPGVWFDFNNTNFVIRNCIIYNNKGLLHDNSGSGIRCELDPGPALIEHNIFYGNTGPHLEVCSSRQFTIRDNTFKGGSLYLKDWPRGEEYTLKDVTIEHNIFKNAYIGTESDNWDLLSPALKRITIDNDQFQSDGKMELFRWGSQDIKTLGEAQRKLGFESKGSVTDEQH